MTIIDDGYLTITIDSGGLTVYPSGGAVSATTGVGSGGASSATNVNNGTSGSIYISGPTSTGWYTYKHESDSDLAVPVEKKKDCVGCRCKKCKEFKEYAESNQPDGSLICWVCRHGY